MEISAYSTSIRVVFILPEPEILPSKFWAVPDAVKEPDPDMFSFKFFTVILRAATSPEPETTTDIVRPGMSNDETVPVSEPETVNCVKTGIVIIALQFERPITYPC